VILAAHEFPASCFQVRIGPVLDALIDGEYIAVSSSTVFALAVYLCHHPTIQLRSTDYSKMSVITSAPSFADLEWIIAYTRNKEDQASLDTLKTQFMVIDWDPKSGLTVGPLRTLPGSGTVSTLVNPERTSNTASDIGENPVSRIFQLGISGVLCDNDPPHTVEFDGKVYRLTSDCTQSINFLAKQKQLEEQAIKLWNEESTSAYFDPLENHQLSSKAVLGPQTISDVNQAWKAIMSHLPGFPRGIKDNFCRWHRTGGLEPAEAAAYRLAMIALAAIKIIKQDDPFKGKREGLLAVANAVEVGMFHRRLVLAGYPQTIRQIAAEIVSDAAL
jgi:hypothetical protein